MSSLGKNFGVGGSPYPSIFVVDKKLKYSASVSEFDSITRLNAMALVQGTSGNYNGLVGPGAMKVSM